MADGNGMSPADFAAMAGNGNLNEGGGWWCFLLIILFFICGFGGNGAWGGSNASAATDAAIAAQGGYVTNAQLNDSLRMQSLQQGQRDITDNVNQNKYDITGAMNAVEQRLTANQSSLMTNQAANAQAQQACCADVKYNSALNASSINQTVTQQSQRVLDALAADKADRQAQRINDLQQQLNAAQYQNALQQATFGTVKYPTMSAYNSGMNPFCNCGTPVGCCA